MNRKGTLETGNFIARRVAEYYWRDDMNCANTTLKLLDDDFETDLHE